MGEDGKHARALLAARRLRLLAGGAVEPRGQLHSGHGLRCLLLALLLLLQPRHHVLGDGREDLRTTEHAQGSTQHALGFRPVPIEIAFCRPRSTRLENPRLPLGTTTPAERWRRSREIELEHPPP